MLFHCNGISFFIILNILGTINETAYIIIIGNNNFNKAYIGLSDRKYYFKFVGLPLIFNISIELFNPRDL